VPGSPLDPRAKGCNDLIRQGAAICEGVDDVLRALEGFGGFQAPGRRGFRKPKAGSTLPSRTFASRSPPCCRQPRCPGTTSFALPVAKPVRFWPPWRNLSWQDAQNSALEGSSLRPEFLEQLTAMGVSPTFRSLFSPGFRPLGSPVAHEPRRCREPRKGQDHQ